MELGIVWLLCAAVFLELASRAPEAAEPDFGGELCPLAAGTTQSAGVAAEALSLKTAAGDGASS
jgi:hypothetical protein